MFTILVIAIVVTYIYNMYNEYIEEQRRKHIPVWIQLIEEGNTEAGMRMLARLNAAKDRADGMRCDDDNCEICK